MRRVLPLTLALFALLAPSAVAGGTQALRLRVVNSTSSTIGVRYLAGGEVRDGTIFPQFIQVIDQIDPGSCVRFFPAEEKPTEEGCGSDYSGIRFHCQGFDCNFIGGNPPELRFNRRLGHHP